MKIFISILSFALLVIVGCGKPKPDPIITGFEPDEGSVGMAVTVKGLHFGNNLNQVQVYFNRAVAPEVTAVTDSILIVLVPLDATTGKITVSIDGNTTSSGNDFTVQ